MLHSFPSPSFCVISALGTRAGVSDERGSFLLEHRATVSLFLCLGRLTVIGSFLAEIRVKYVMTAGAKIPSLGSLLQL